MNIMANRKIFLSVSLALVVLSFVFFAIWPIKFGIDFSGGTLWQIKAESASAEQFKNFFEQEIHLKNLAVFPSDDGGFILRFGHISDADHNFYAESLKKKFGSVEELRFETIGPAVGSELKRKALWAVILVMLGISLYVAFAFRKVSYPVKSLKYGAITLITLFHDVIIPVGFYSLLGRFLGLEMDINFIVAVLVVMGFSVHDTIVVFDRIRENLLKERAKFDLPKVINESVSETFVRSINTSLTLVIVLLTLFFFGPENLKYFVLTMLVGTLVGTYSSIFVASPLLLPFRQKNTR